MSAKGCRRAIDRARKFASRWEPGTREATAWRGRAGPELYRVGSISITMLPIFCPVSAYR
jgi:hypothetical protein